MNLNDRTIAWPEEFVVSWSTQIAQAFRLEHRNGWIKRPCRPALTPIWLRGPLLSYTDFRFESDLQLDKLRERNPGRFRIFSLAAENAALEAEQPVVMRMNLVGSREDELFRDSLSGGCRNRLRKSLRSGLAFHWIEPGADILPAWSILEDIHRRLGSPLFPMTLLARLQAANIARIGIVSSEGEAVAMLVLVIAGDIAWVPWCGAIASHHRSSPNHLSHWEAIKVALDSGCKVFDFGRSAYLGGTYEFKRKWGAVPVPIVEITEKDARPAFVNYQLSSIFSERWRRLPAPVSSRLGPLVFKALAL